MIVGADLVLPLHRVNMTKLFHFDSPQEDYRADACVISCFDARFDRVVRKFLRKQSIEFYDQVKIPGSARALSTSAGAAEREIALGMVRTSIRLHRPSRVWLFAHADCGAYRSSTLEIQMADLRSAADFMRSSEPSLPVECFYCNFDGVYSVAQGAAGGAF